MSLPTPARLARMLAVASKRTRHIVPVFDAIYKAGNVSAVLRTIDACGFQDAYIALNHMLSIKRGITKGADKWLNIHQNDPIHVYQQIKAAGYTVAVTSPHADGYTPFTVPLNKPLAVVFGNEEFGVSNFFMDHAECFIQIPMYGFTESFNLSVSAALVLHTLSTRIRSDYPEYILSGDEQQKLVDEWIAQREN